MSEKKFPMPPKEAMALVDPETTEETVEVESEKLIRLITSYLFAVESIQQVLGHATDELVKKLESELAKEAKKAPAEVPAETGGYGLYL